ncbi:homocysteine S-methyltransferase YbgG-like isoform X2 [Haliotis rubra]|uniref:homocysteine S-methyltransferase YbgG-like isoform X2 n=1 Tax=Haliotis rubra TaxID=36100 RepID=UPI001EE61C36|nr:homocysteine S-methyltransferase YbgG-like isoform X2 [Haliotis rubra]
MASDTKTESNRKLQRLVGQKYVLLDGGSATEMVRIGCKNIDNDPLWSARLLKTNPETVMQVHKNFLLAGSEVLDTASYQASVQGFVDHLGVDHDTALSLIGQSVVLAREACTETGCDAVVAGCVGPYGAVLHDGSEYTGAYAEKITREEACVTCDGERFSDAVRSVVQSDQVLAVGLNCTAPEHVCDLLESVQHLQLQKGVVVKPNSGEQWVRDEGWIPGSGCVSLGNQVKTWVDRGATWIGGCCRVYPDDIAKMKKELDRL